MEPKPKPLYRLSNKLVVRLSRVAARKAVDTAMAALAVLEPDAQQLGVETLVNRRALTPFQANTVSFRLAKLTDRERISYGAELAARVNLDDPRMMDLAVRVMDAKLLLRVLEEARRIQTEERAADEAAEKALGIAPSTQPETAPWDLEEEDEDFGDVYVPLG